MNIKDNQTSEKPKDYVNSVWTKDTSVFEKNVMNEIIALEQKKLAQHGPKPMKKNVREQEKIWRYTALVVGCAAGVLLSLFLLRAPNQTTKLTPIQETLVEEKANVILFEAIVNAVEFDDEYTEIF